MRRSMSVPRISTAARRDRLAAHGGERVGLGAVGAAGAPGADAAAPASSGRTCARERVHCSGWRQSCETLIVTRSRNASSSAGSALQPREVVGQVRGAAARRRRSGCGAPSGARLYWSRSTPQSRRNALAEARVVVGRDGAAGGCGARERSSGGSAASSRRPSVGRAVERRLVGEAGLRDRARHAVDGAGRLGLDEDRPPAALDGLGAVAGRRGPCRSARRAAARSP